MKPISLLLLAAAAAIGCLSGEPSAQREAAQLQNVLQTRLDELYTESGAPGVNVGIVLEDGTAFGLAAGFADTVLGLPMEPTSRLMQGSVGKTYVSAVAMQLVHEGLLDLDAKVSDYLGEESWFERLPNHSDVTVRHLMSHTSGIIRYEFDDRFITDLVASPDRVWQPEELLSYLFDTEAPFAAGDGWEYSDTNYIILGLIIELLTGNSYYDEMRNRILQPLELHNTVPTDTRRVPGLVQGYAGVENLFRVPDAVIVDGEFAINPQFEWTGGGIASTAEDLARWAEALYEGRAFDESMLPVLLDGVPAQLGPESRYGLGVIIRPTPLGVSWGHSGFFPGYLTEMAYFPDHEIAIAVQLNSSDFQNLSISAGRILMELATLVVEQQTSRN
jgi:D-alanyl-D-alanine carboxypeptidase